MIKSKKLKELEARIFELEASVGMLEIFVENLMQSQGLKIELDAEKWYAETD